MYRNTFNRTEKDLRAEKGIANELELERGDRAELNGKPNASRCNDISSEVLG